jgi:hypothetical protein
MVLEQVQTPPLDRSRHGALPATGWATMRLPAPGAASATCRRTRPRRSVKHPDERSSGPESIMSPIPSRKRNFVVAGWEKGRQRRRDLRRVRATSHEEAVAVVAASRILPEEGAVFEAWPAKEPGCILRITLAPRKPRRTFPV